MSGQNYECHVNDTFKIKKKNHLKESELSRAFYVIWHLVYPSFFSSLRL